MPAQSKWEVFTIAQETPRVRLTGWVLGAMARLAGVLLLLPAICFAECAKEAPIDLAIVTGVESVEAGGDHGFFDQVTITAPSEVNGIPLESIFLTRGEVAEFWIPLAFELEEGRAKVVFDSNPEFLESLEVLVIYKTDQCSYSIQKGV